MIADRTGHSVIVDEQAMYKNRIWHADAEATVEWRRGTVNYMLSPRAEGGSPRPRTPIRYGGCGSRSSAERYAAAQNGSVRSGA